MIDPDDMKIASAYESPSTSGIYVAMNWQKPSGHLISSYLPFPLEA